MTNVNIVARFVDLVAERLTARVSDTVQASLQRALSEIDAIKSELSEAKNKLLKVEDESQRRADELEQYQRRNNLRVFGVKESAREDTDKLVIDIFKKQLNVDVSLADIDRSHRVGKVSQPGSDGVAKPRPIIVKFVSYRTRRAVFSNKKKLKGSELSIREDLTPHRHRLLLQAIQQHGRGNVWSVDGRITWVIDENAKTFGRATWSL